MRKEKKFIKNLNKKANKLCEGKDHVWLDLFADIDKCKKCGVIRKKRESIK